MPEGPEVKIASTYFNTYFDKSDKIKFEILTDYYDKKYSDVFLCINNNIKSFRPTYTIGKNIFLNLDNDLVFNFHLGMTGGWSHELIKHCHFRVYSHKRELFFRDIRKFGKMRIINQADIIQKHIKEFDLLNKEYDIIKHTKFLSKKITEKKSVCSVLMNQAYFPGVGNYIKSEALYLSKIHPEEKWKNLNTKNIKNLIDNTQKIMHNSYKTGGAELRDFKNPFSTSLFKLKIYGKQKTPKNNLVESKVTSDQRKTWFCPVEQKLKKKK